MKIDVRRAACALLVATTALTASCGYMLHPERRGAHSQRLDPFTVTLDCLLLLPGVIPGVVALIVDGVNDTWYFAPEEHVEETGGAGFAIEVGGQLRLRLETLAEDDAEVALRVEAPDGRTLGRTTQTVRADDPPAELTVRIAADVAPTDAVLVLAVNDVEQARWPVRITDVD